MAFTCGFFNSVAHDRKYDAVQHGMIFDGIITDGIYATYLKAMVVKASENASEVIVQPGRAWFNHTWSYNDSDYPVAAPEPEVVLDRIDTLVLDVNSEDAVRNNQFLWVQGTPTSQTPEPPALIHTATHNQYPLCDVYRQAGTTMIYAADITNRVGTSDCPFVTGVLESIDIDDLLAQWDDEFHTWENATKASFEGWMLNQQSVYTAWFNALKTQMAGDVADVEAWVQTIKDIIDEETATHLQLEIDEINSMLPSGSHITVTTSDTELYSRTVTIADEDNNTVTSQFDANGVAVFKSVPYVGNLTITSTDGVRTATEVVNTPYFARYEFTLAFWSATVNIIGDSSFGGDTVTITDSTTALVGTVVLNASGTGVFNATYPDTYKFSVTHGGETMEVSLAVTQETTYNVEIHSGLNYQAWLNAGRVSKSFSSLDDVLADEKTLRQLFLVHDAVDYICNEFDTGLVTDITKIFNTNLAAKWINNSDYALDHFYAVSGIKSIMDTADKYGYGEWVNNNGTWGPKGNVPVMTANNAPYGEAISSGIEGNQANYFAFDGNDGTYYSSSTYNTSGGEYIGYKSVMPILAKKVVGVLGIIYTAGQTLTLINKIQGSNDGTNWIDISDNFSVTAVSSGSADEVPFEVTLRSTDYYLYHRIYRVSSSPVALRLRLFSLQFYGRELKVSVPTMTSNTAPFGEAFESSYDYVDSYLLQAWRAFDKDVSTALSRFQANGKSNQYLGYTFSSPMVLKVVALTNHSTAARNPKEIKFQYKNGDTWIDATDIITNPTTVDLTTFYTLSNENQVASKDWRVFILNNYGDASYISIRELQFYGLDYSEKEFEEGTTKKWLYDHGVEVIDLGSPIITGSAITEKQDSQFYGKLVTSGTNSYAFAPSSAIDLSSYSLMRAKVGNQLYASNNNEYPLQMMIKASRSFSNSDYTTIAIDRKQTPITNPYTASSLDISSITSTAYPMFADSTSGADRIATISEWWLE